MLTLKPFVTRTHGRPMMNPIKGAHLSLSLRTWVCHPHTRTHVRLLGPCFKTGRLKPFCQPGTTARQREEVSITRRRSTNPPHIEPQREPSLTRNYKSASADTHAGGGLRSLTQKIRPTDSATAKLVPNASLLTISSTF